MNDRHQKTAYPLRMPDDLRSQLEKSAHEVGRSLNSEIIARLQQTFEVGTLSSAPVLFSNFDALAEALVDRMLVKSGFTLHPPEPPQFSNQADDMPVDAPKRRVKLNRGKS